MSTNFGALMDDIDRGVVSYKEADALIREAEEEELYLEQQHQRIVAMHAAVGEFDEEDWTDPRDWNAIDGPDVLPLGFP